MAMTHEYDDPVTNATIERAVRLAVSLRSRRQSAPLDELVTEAVDATFCTCVTSAADACTRGRAPTHAGLIAEVTRLVQPLDAGSDTIADLPDPVDFSVRGLLSCQRSTCLDLALMSTGFATGDDHRSGCLHQHKDAVKHRG
jgi:hypothetical protein